MTPLPDPHPDACVGNSIDGWTGVYTEEQMREYGKAERERALEEAVTTCESFDSCDPKYIAAAIRALKEKP